MEHAPRQTAETFFAHLSANELDRAMDLLSEDSTVWIATMPAGSPGPEHTGTTVPKPAFADMMAKSQQLAPAGMQFTIHRCLADQTEVAMELESRADLADGRLYNNRYVFWLRVEEGRITELREYFDSKYANDFFLGLLNQRNDERTTDEHA